MSDSSDNNAPADNGTPKIANVNNGYTTDKYSWTQSVTDVTLSVPVPPGTPSKSIDVHFDRKSFRVGLKGQPPILSGELYAPIKADDAFWNLEDKKLIMITMEKFYTGRWWTCVLVGEPELDSQKFEPANAKLADLDPEVRQSVEKMLFDQRQKSLGLPTSEDMKKQEMLKKFAADYPQFDFSQTKFT